MLTDEQVLTFPQAAAQLPRLNGKRPHASTIWRWARKGLRGIHLETRRVGGRFVTSIEALERFTKALAEADQNQFETPQSTPRQPTNGQRQKAVARAESTLRTAGIL